MKAAFIWLTGCLIFSTFNSALSQCQVCSGTCNAEYYYDYSTFVCLPCPSGCANCTDAATCTQCSSGMGLTSSNNCISCSVLNCATCTSPGICTSCQSGYYLSSGTCLQKCGTTLYTDPLTQSSIALYLCNTCTSSTTCTNCLGITTIQSMYQSNYIQATATYIDSNGTCQFCPTGCSSCSAPGTSCSTCSSGYYSTGTGCNPCENNCYTCDSTGTHCVTCPPYFYVSGGNCYACSDSCSACVDNNTCTTCQTGYFLNTNSGCTSCIENCDSCSDAFSCKTCSSGFQYIAATSDITISQCIACPDGCVGCLSTYALSIGICALDAAIISLNFIFVLIFVCLGMIFIL